MLKVNHYFICPAQNRLNIMTEMIQTLPICQLLSLFAFATIPSMTRMPHLRLPMVNVKCDRSVPSFLQNYLRILWKLYFLRCPFVNLLGPSSSVFAVFVPACYRKWSPWPLGLKGQTDPQIAHLDSISVALILHLHYFVYLQSSHYYSLLALAANLFSF